MSIKKVIFGSILTLFMGTLDAGFTQPAPVEIDFDNRFAVGDMVTARFSENEFELIGCGIRKIEISDTEVFSFVTFSWNEDGECTRIGNSTQSFYIPEFKDKKDKKDK